MLAGLDQDGDRVAFHDSRVDAGRRRSVLDDFRQGRFGCLALDLGPPLDLGTVDPGHLHLKGVQHLDACPLTPGLVERPLERGPGTTGVIDTDNDPSHRAHRMAPFLRGSRAAGRRPIWTSWPDTPSAESNDGRRSVVAGRARPARGEVRLMGIMKGGADRGAWWAIPQCPVAIGGSMSASCSVRRVERSVSPMRIRRQGQRSRSMLILGRARSPQPRVERSGTPGAGTSLFDRPGRWAAVRAHQPRRTTADRSTGPASNRSRGPLMGRPSWRSLTLPRHDAAERRARGALVGVRGGRSTRKNGSPSRVGP